MKFNNMTSGPIVKQLVAFSLPLLLGSLIQQLYNTVDIIYVANAVGKQAAAAVGASTLLVTCMVGLFTGLAVGSSVVAGHRFGAGDMTGLHKVVHNSAAIGIYGGLAFTVLGVCFAPFLLTVLNTPDDIFAQASIYIRIYFLSLIPMIIYNVGSGVIRAIGDSRSPMIYQLVGGIVNVIADGIFIVVFDWGVMGAACATLCSQGIAGILTFRHLLRLHSDYCLTIHEIRFERDTAVAILCVGIPAGIQAMSITLSNLIVQMRINGLGVDSIAAFTAYFKVEMFIYLPIVAFGQAVTTFISQNVGAGKLDRVTTGTRKSLLVGSAFTAGITAVVIILIHPLFRLFSNDAAVIDLGVHVGLIAIPFYIFYLWMEVFSSVIRGSGKAIVTMVILIANMCGVRVGLLWLFLALSPVVTSVAWVYPCTWLCTAISMAVYYQWGPWRKNVVALPASS